MTVPTLDAVFENFSTDTTVTVTSDRKNTNTTLVEIFVEQLALTLNVYYTPVLIVLGCVGNLISIIVFFNSKLRQQSTSQYLSALAMSDTIFLCQLLPPWLKAVGVSTLFSRDGYCQLFVYLSYVSCNNSSWLVVAFTIERFVAVVYPLQRNAMCTAKRARHIIVSLAVAALLINLPVLRFAVPKGNDCNIDELLLEHAERFNLVDTMVSFTLPLAVIVVLNAWIMWGVCRVSRARSNLQQSPFNEHAPQVDRSSGNQRSQQRVTKMLLIVSSVFVLLNLPAYTMRIVAYANNMSENEYIGIWAALQQVCLLCFNTNYGINFVLYCMTGQNFRQTLKETFLSLRRPKLSMIELRGKSEDTAARASSASTSFAHSYSNNQTDATSTGNNEQTGSNNAPDRSGMGQANAEQSGEERIGIGTRRSILAQVEYEGPTRRRRHDQQVIQRWRFDNSRQQRRESVEQQQPSGNI